MKKSGAMMNSMLPSSIISIPEMMELRNIVYTDTPNPSQKPTCDKYWSWCMCAIIAIWCLSAQCVCDGRNSGLLLNRRDGSPMSLDCITSNITGYLFGRSNGEAKDHKRAAEVLEYLIDAGFLAVDESTGAYYSPVWVRCQSDAYINRGKNQDITSRESSAVRKQQQRLRDKGLDEMDADGIRVYVFSMRAKKSGYSDKRSQDIAEAWATQWCAEHPGQEIPDVRDFDKYIRGMNEPDQLPDDCAVPDYNEPEPDAYADCGDGPITIPVRHGVDEEMMEYN